ncbi:COP9 signalosome catalytic subunit rri1 [Umbelopsis nana]
MAGVSIAQKNWELENNVTTIDPDQDSLYFYDADQQRAIGSEQPWKSDPHYYSKVRISAVALIKMVTHARSGGNIEIMGLMQGKVVGDTMIVMDAFALPVEGTETRVSAQDQAYEYMVAYMEKIKEIDPNRTMSAGKVDIGAFRTYPEGYKTQDDNHSEYQNIPLNKIEDFGVHARSYYPLEVSHFKSTLDTQLLELLWNKYWVNTLSQSPLLTNREYSTHQISDLAQKLEQAESGLQSRMAYFGDRRKGEESQLSKVTKDSSKITVEANHGLISQVLKHLIFNQTRHERVENN